MKIQQAILEIISDRRLHPEREAKFKKFRRPCWPNNTAVYIDKSKQPDFRYDPPNGWEHPMFDVEDILADDYELVG